LLPDDQKPPDEIILKLSWPLEGRCTEGDMFRPLRGEFGIPYVLDAFAVADTQGRPFETRDFCSDKREFWDVLVSHEEKKALAQAPNVVFANRKLYAVFMKTAGQPLKCVSTVGDMLRAVLHAMLGHYVLYISGWLHRDVSTGNVVLLKTPESRRTEKVKDILPEKVQLGDCTGMIIDGDHAIKWKEQRNDPADSRSGTLPFLSYRLTDTWRHGQRCLHTAIDDLESFIYVLLVAVLEKCGLRLEGLSQEEWDIYQAFHEDDLKALAIFKQALATKMSMSLDDNPDQFSPAIHLISPLIIAWSTEAMKYQSKLRKYAVQPKNRDDYDELCQGAYRFYLEKGFEILESIKDEKHDW